MAACLILTVGACGEAVTSGSGSPSASPSPSASSAVAKKRQLIGNGDILSNAAVYGDLVWTAGHLPEGLPTDAPMRDQVERVLDNLERTLEASGAGFDTLLKVNIYLLDWDDWTTFTDMYVERIGMLLPPRTTVQVAHIGLDYRIEMEAVAHVRGTAP